MFVIRKKGKDFTLPLSDQQMIRIMQETTVDLFLPVANAQCIKAECGGMDLSKKLPRKVWAQEMNMLAYTIQQFQPAQIRKFLKSIAEVPFMYPGEMLNYALRICPEAAGLKLGVILEPYYTGENLFDIMEYKRFCDRRRENPEIQMAKFYVPVDVWRMKEGDDEIQDISGEEASAYIEPLSQMLANHIRLRNNWSDWATHSYILENPPYCAGGLLFEHPDLEIRDGELWGVIHVETSHVFTDAEIDSLKEYFNERISDGWGNNLRPVDLPEGRLCIHFNECTEVLQQGKGEIQLSETMMFLLQTPYLVQRIWNHTEFVADFRNEWEYGRNCMIWMELSFNRKTVRVPLPADEKTVWKARSRLGAMKNDFVSIKLKTHEIRFLDNLLFDTLDLKAFNKLASEIHLMTPESGENLWQMFLRSQWPYDGLILAVGQTLEKLRKESSISENGE